MVKSASKNRRGGRFPIFPVIFGVCFGNYGGFVSLVSFRFVSPVSFRRFGS